MTKASRNSMAAGRKVIAYVRISRDRANETSTETQEAAIRAWCIAHSHDLVKVIVEPGRSAFKSSRSSRPGFREAMQLIGAGAANVLAVWKVDRACRNTLDLLTLVQDLEAHGAGFASTTEQFDTTTPMGRAMMTIVGVLAELESAQKSERTSEWHHHRRINAAVPAGPAALGYCKPRPNELEPDPAVAPLVHAAATAIAAGASVLSQSKALTAAGVKISHTGLRTALRSPTMAGLVAVSETALARRGGARVLDDVELASGGWEPILDRELWNAVRAVLEDPHRSQHVRSNKLRYALAPIARCHCGSSMHVHIERWTKKSGTGEMPRLLCDDTSCATGIGYDAVDAAVSAAVLDLLDDATWSRIRSASTGVTADVHAVEEKLARLWLMVLDGTVEPEDYAEAKTRWAGELTVSVTAPVDLPDVSSVRDAWPDFIAAERHLVLRAAIRSLVIKAATRRGGRGVDLARIDLETV